MLAYLDAENAYADAVLAPTKPVQDKLYDEIVGAHQAGRRQRAVPRTRLLVLHPFRDRQGLPDPGAPQGRRGHGCDCRSRRPTSRRLRRRGDPARRQRDGRRQEVLRVGDAKVSQDNRCWPGPTTPTAVASTRSASRTSPPARCYPTAITGASANVVWADDNKTLFYVENDPETLLTTKVKKHVLGTDREGRRARLRGEGRQLLHGHRPHPRRPVHRHRRGQHGVERAALHASRRPGRVHRARAARARRRIRRRPPRRSLGHPHQRWQARRTSRSSPPPMAPPRARTGRTGSRTATTSMSKASSCSTASPRSPSVPAGWSACAC